MSECLYLDFLSHETDLLITFYPLISFFLCTFFFFLEGKLSALSFGDPHFLLPVATLFITFTSSLCLKSHLGVSELYLAPCRVLFQFLSSAHSNSF